MNLIVYQANDGQELLLSLEQHELIQEVGVWPCDSAGQPFAHAWLVFRPVGGPSLSTIGLLDYLGIAPSTMEVAA